MGYQFEAELREQAGKLIDSLAEDGIQGSTQPDGLRDFMIKINISRDQVIFGNVNLYYSPKKKSFSLKTHELTDKSIVPDVETTWVRNISINQIAVMPPVVDQENISQRNILLAKAEYLYHVMAPYRDCWFDFSGFAEVLEQLCNCSGKLEKPRQIIDKAYDFYALESIYRKIKETPI